MKVAIMSTMPPNTYSGGRYHAWVMAECLAYKKNDVYFITNHMPIFYDDFKGYEAHERVKLILTPDFEVEIEEDKLDYVVLVPNQDKNDYFYVMCRNFARKKNAKLVLLNFETPNWFNKYSPTPRDEKMWDFWKAACDDGCLVLSNSKESMKWAKEYYTENPKYTRFNYWYPAINSKVADSIDVEKEKRIISFVRFQDKHKGGGDIFDLFGEYLKGYTMVFVVGNGRVDKVYENKIEFLSEKYGFQYEFKLRLSDEEKFREIKRAQIMLFPSYFEGFGYPPVEAQYCNTQCVAYDLPVLRETSGDGITYCERGNIYALKETLQEVIENYEFIELKKNILECGDFEIRANAIEDALRMYLDDDYRDPRAHYLKVNKPEDMKKKQTPPKVVQQVKTGREKSIVSSLKAVIYNASASGFRFAKRLTRRIINEVFLWRIQLHLGAREYDKDTGNLYLKGWYLTWRDIDKVEILNGKGEVLGFARFGLKRPDVYKRFPRYGTVQLGYEFEGTVKKEDMDGMLRIRLKCSDGKTTWADFQEENKS